MSGAIVIRRSRLLGQGFNRGGIAHDVGVEAEPTQALDGPPTGRALGETAPSLFDTVTWDSKETKFETCGGYYGGVVELATSAGFSHNGELYAEVRCQ